jgi:CTP:molybdopterin cytidylyltransferase MocA
VIAGLVLAAGRSSRMGSLKVLLPIGGRPLVRFAIEAAGAAALDDVVVVVGRDGDLVADTITGFGIEGVRTVGNDDWRSGQASSLRAGLDAMAPGTDAAVVMLADQPTIGAAAITAVVDAFRAGAGPVVQASYGGRPAHPTLLARPVWRELASLTGDVGAREAIAGHPEWRTLVEVGGDVPADVDTQEDYERMRLRIERATTT